MQSQQQNQNHQPHPKATPGRRRGANRHFGHSPAHKTYASENDMPSDISFAVDLISQLPLTPQKQQLRNSPGPASQSSNPRSKPRTANKAKQKPVSTSPQETRHGRTTPPQSSAPKSVAVAAFAGATFHASPAPSSLPIPSFLAKALDSPGLKSNGRENQEPSPPATDTEPPTPQHRIVKAEITREESPLDIFFKADRAEKERARRASSANIFSTMPRPFSPPPQSQSPQEARTVPNGPSSLRTRRPGGPQRTTSSGISSVELDGTPGKPMGPSFSTPYQERIRAARSAQKPQQQQPIQILQRKSPASPPDQGGASEELSNKLKRFLAIPTEPEDGNIQTDRTVTATSTTTSSTFQTSGQRPASTSYGVQSIPARHAAAQGSTISANRGGNPRPTDVLDMENSLRRMLKIDAGMGFAGAAASPASYQSS